MATNITMPQMGFDMTEGTIAAWLKQEGETVAKGDPIAEIETDKTTIQIEAFASGVLAKIVVQAGQKTPVGEVIGVIAAPGEAVGVYTLVADYNSVDRYRRFTRDLAARGWSQMRLEKLMGGNFLRVYREAWGG